MIYTESRISAQDFSKNKILKKQGNVEIGDYTWVGAHVFIRQGVRIGKNCVIGANSVVINDIPDFSIVGGVPARNIGIVGI